MFVCGGRGIIGGKTGITILKSVSVLVSNNAYNWQAS